MTTLKELLRHGLHKMGLDSVLKLYKRRRGYITSHLDPEGLNQRFTHIYEKGVWVQGSECESLSGVGSELSATRALREELPQLLVDLGCSTIIDVGCGDFNWMSRVDLDCDYIGLDIVPAVVRTNSDRYGSEHRRFMVLDASKEEIPTGEVVLCREVLFHLSFEDGQRLLHNIRRSGARYLLATSDSHLRFNADIRSGDYRPLNIERRPYNLPPPLGWLTDDAVSDGRALGIWQICGT